MKICRPALAAALAALALPMLASAQPGTPSSAPVPAAVSATVPARPGSAASASSNAAPKTPKPGTRLLMTPAEQRKNFEISPATAGATTRAPDERPVAIPQIRIPLGQRAPTSRSSDSGAVRGGVNDSAASCEALADAQSRAACRERVAAQSNSR